MSRDVFVLTRIKTRVVFSPTPTANSRRRAFARNVEFSFIVSGSERTFTFHEKLSQKAYADEKNRASTNPVAPGDQVLLKNTKTTGKLAPNYGKEPYTVLTKEGDELMLKSKDGGIYRRDSSFVKPFNPPEEVDLPLTVDLASEGEQVMSEKPLDAVIEHARPKRVTRLPNKLKDYVVEKAK